MLLHRPVREEAVEVVVLQRVVKGQLVQLNAPQLEAGPLLGDAAALSSVKSDFLIFLDFLT